MKQILVYGDSMSWGIIPGTRKRLTFEKRWPGIMEEELKACGKSYRILENCLNGRRSVWADPHKEGRDGSVGLAQVVEMHSPLTLVIIMLGCNDFQRAHQNNAWLSAQGIARLISIIRQAPIEPEMVSPDILVVAEPAIVQPNGDMAEKFRDAEKKSLGMIEAYHAMAQEQGVHFMDANELISCSTIDGIHLEESEHSILGKSMAARVQEIL